MIYGSLFTGVGLLDLGVEMAFRDAGVPLACAWQVEIDPFCRAVLAKHWPEVPRHEDVTRVDGAALARVDLIVGGFPCQDISVAGAGAGLAGARSGLWFEYLRLVAELRPRGVLIENVAGLVRRGLDVVVEGLVGAGYAVEATRIRASDLGAPQRRERLFVVASRGVADAEREPLRVEQQRQPPRPSDGVRDEGQAEPRHDGGARRRAAESVVGGVPDGRPAWLDESRWPAPPGVPQHEWEPARAEAVVRNRAERLMALGNGVVPQCAYVAARRVLERLEAR